MATTKEANQPNGPSHDPNSKGKRQLSFAKFELSLSLSLFLSLQASGLPTYQALMGQQSTSLCNGLLSPVSYTTLCHTGLLVTLIKETIFRVMGKLKKKTQKKIQKHQLNFRSKSYLTLILVILNQPLSTCSHMLSACLEALLFFK